MTLSDQERLTRLLHDLPSPMASRPGRATAIITTRRRRKTHALLAAASAIVLLVIGTVTVHLTRNTPNRVTAVGDGHRRDVTQPVAVDCGARLPLSILTAARDVVDTNTEAGAALRSFLAHPAIADLATYPREDWALLYQSRSRMSFGQRTGASGVSGILTLARTAGGWTFDSSGGCGPLIYPDGHAAVIEGVAANGGTLSLTWLNGTCFPDAVEPIHSDLLRRVQVTETPTSVLLAVVVAANPAEARALGDAPCLGVGLTDTSTITLKQPLGSRHLVDVGFVPPRPVDSPTTS